MSRDTSIKQVILIRTDLGMRKGKMIAQGAHASMKVFFDCATYESWPEGYERTKVPIEVDKNMYGWMTGLFTKVVCKVTSETELVDLYEQAKNEHIPCALIRDAGLTEFHGIPTLTAAAIGPALSQDIDLITGHLKLL